MFRRQRFGDVIARQLELFRREQADLFLEIDAAEAKYDHADRTEAEELYGDYQDLVEAGTEILADLRDHYASSLGEQAAEQYEGEFNDAVRRDLPRFSLEIENR